MKDIKKLFQAGLAFLLLFSNLLAVGQDMKITPRIETQPLPTINQYQSFVQPDITQFRTQDLIRPDYVFIQRDDHVLLNQNNDVNQRLIQDNNTKNVQLKDNRQ